MSLKSLLKRNKEIVISYKNGLFDPKTGKDITHTINSIRVDNQVGIVYVTIQKGLKVNTVHLTMQEAQSEGFINLEPIKKFCI